MSPRFDTNITVINRISTVSTEGWYLRPHVLVTSVCASEAPICLQPIVLFANSLSRPWIVTVVQLSLCSFHFLKSAVCYSLSYLSNPSIVPFCQFYKCYSCIELNKESSKCELLRAPVVDGRCVRAACRNDGGRLHWCWGWCCADREGGCEFTETTRSDCWRVQLRTVEWP